MGTFDDEGFYKGALVGFLGVAALIYYLVSRVKAPYGRHMRKGWGPSLAAVDGWILMESPALWSSFLVNAFGRHKAEFVPKLLLKVYQLHYFHRTLIYPFRIRADGKKMPYLVAACGFFFNIYNAYLQARWISHFGAYPSSWLSSPQFIIGSVLFLVGMVINIWADSVLINLRYSRTDMTYRIPKGLLFHLVTCPNYLGESLEWLGWAVMTWSLPGFAFFLATVATLLPRALAHHAWYMSKFPDYPRTRKALFPYII